MKSPRFWLAVLVAGIVCNALDAYVQGTLLTKAFFSNIASINPEPKVAWLVTGDFVAMLVLAWVMDRLGAVFGSGAKGGAQAGLVLGVLVNFPRWHLVGLLFKGVPYALVWIETGYCIAVYTIAGAIIGAILRKPAAAAG